MDRLFTPKPVKQTKSTKRHQGSDQDKPFWKRCLLAVPKNLVYVFALVVVFAFLCMLYITSTGYDLAAFV
jgi:ABC-type uncharacterized transport system permease subunit